jgi:glycogen debranching enzyme
MALARLGSERAFRSGSTLGEDFLDAMPIQGHVAELFDAEAPYAARGCPAQAWSLACLEEHRTRRRDQLDTCLLEELAKSMSSLERRTG